MAQIAKKERTPRPNPAPAPIAYRPFRLKKKKRTVSENAPKKGEGTAFTIVFWGQKRRRGKQIRVS